ncbi:MAG TPA: trypsin-like peptidase domain-containing protein [Leptospiraceae bacterium]|jgi:serine protease Do|nr:trypsin-like peptidase domain-containing protein [Leptospirales bacterium]HMU83252.1 trypsin-like peptidase domain-containing protein [Leptospiraceae bacterium]HMW60358.1 trypsin-like peptidase domain-containing protein [Leptospiraceae bacterium]HMX58045.1 trypsin-like peptidase domain-containing protein [Leptospiraceae bacterium]HNE22175.1 trypsin-like peptidase domain-containing protein [Leptospiraceae bacterium]
MFKSVRLTRLGLINLILFTLFIGAFLSPLIYSGFRSMVLDHQSSADPIPESDQKAAIALQQSYMNVFKKASPSVVFIRTRVLVPPRYWFDLYSQQEGAGTGIVIDKAGYIVTNNHVVAGAQKIEVVFPDQRKERAKLIGRDETSDIAVIQIPGSDKLVPAVLGDSDKVAPGQLAFALGSPFGLESTFTVGVISAKHRSIDNTKYTRIQTDTSINPGNSGGPLLNVYGEVVGINQSIISPGGQGGSVGIGFAIPINEAKSVIEQLRKERRVIGRPTLGVQVGVPTPNLRQFLKVSEEYGLVVRFVVPGSAAEDAGMKANDYLLKANDKELREPDELLEEVAKAGIGGKIKLEFVRGGKKQSVTIAVGEDQSNQ